MHLTFEPLLALKEAEDLGNELAGATAEALKANRSRLVALEDAIVQCEKVRQRVGYAQLVYVRAFLKTGAWRMHGMRTAAEWVAWRLGLDGRTARERVRVAKALEELPQTEAAFAAGAVNYTKARAVARVATREDEGNWLERADGCTADQFERKCREAPSSPRADEGPPEWLVTHTRPDGLVQTTIVLTPEKSALFLKALDTAITLAHGSKTGAVDGDSSASAVDGSNGPNGSGGSDGPNGSGGPRGSNGSDGSDGPRGSDGSDGSDGPRGSDGSDGSDGRRRFGRIDAVVALSNHFLATPPSPSSSPGRYEVLVRVDAEVLQTGDPPLCELADGTPLSPETVRRLSCDAAKLVYRTDEADYPLGVGRRTRTVHASLKRALILRDGGRCRFPGCDAHLFVEAHHLEHWADGGATCLDNLILLCSRHHAWTHEGGGSVRLDEDGCVVFTNAFGEPLPEVAPALLAA